MNIHNVTAHAFDGDRARVRIVIPWKPHQKYAQDSLKCINHKVIYIYSYSLESIFMVLVGGGQCAW